MDFERGVLRAFFLDYPLSKVIDFFNVSNPSFDKDYLKLLPELIRRRMHEFTLTDTREIKVKVFADYFKNTNTMTSVLKYLQKDSWSMLFSDMDAGSPKVKFEQLFRWMEIVRYIDPDSIICACLAKEKGDVKEFLWDNVLPVDMTRCNVDLGEEFNDLHIHYGAAADRFGIMWVDNMNRFTLRHPNKDVMAERGDIIFDEFCFNCRQYDPLNIWKSKYSEKSYFEWVGIASVIRFLLFRYLTEGKTVDKDEKKRFLTALEDNNKGSELLMSYYEKAALYRQSSFKDILVKPMLNGSWDYCLQKSIVTDKVKSSTFSVLNGERWMLYNLFLKIWKNEKDIKLMSIWIYLYLLIKHRVRMEMYLHGDLDGLGNYQLADRESKKGNFNDIRKYLFLYRQKERNNVTSEVRMSFNELVDFNRWPNRPSNVKPILSLSKSSDIDCSHNEVAKVMQINSNYNIVGVDFSGSDTKRRPKEYAKTVKRLRDNGIVNLTYHLGEDYFDLADGLLAVEEVLNVLNWNHTCRIAHLLVLKTDPQTFYEKRHYTVAMPQKLLLECLGCILKRIDGHMDTEKIKREISVIEEKKDKVIIYKWDKWIVEIVKEWQKELVNEITKRHIAIETCPTCNLRVGYFNHYSDLPTCSLLLDENNPIVTINTDAPGILCTNIEHEYALIALTLKKDLNVPDVNGLVNRLKENAKNSQFKRK